MAVSNSNSEVFYNGNASTTLKYGVEFDYLDADHVYVSTIAQGTGTVAIAAGVVTFSSAQATVLIGSHLRIAGITYTIASRTSSTVFAITDHTVTVASTTFHLPDDEDVLTAGEYTLTETGAGAPYITTTTAVATTAKVRVFRQVPYTQLVEFPSTGSVPTASIEDAVDLLAMQIQQLHTEVENSGVVVPSVATEGNNVTFADASARAAAIPTEIGQLGVQLSPLPMTVWIGQTLTAGDWEQHEIVDAVFADAAARAAYTPGQIGQLGFQLDNGKIYSANSLVAGDWADVSSITPLYRVPLADPTGASDSREAIQTVMDAVEAAGGGIVLLDAGTYKIQMLYVAATANCSGGYLGLEIPSNVTLSGAGINATIVKGYSNGGAALTGALYGAVLQNKGARTAAIAYGAGAVEHPTAYGNFHVEDLSLETDQQGDDNGLNIAVVHADGFVCERVKFGSSKYHGVEFNQSRRARFIDCVMDGSYTGGSGSWVQFDFGASGPKSTLVTSQNVDDVQFVRCKFLRESSDTSPRDIDMAHAGNLVPFVVSNVSFVDCEFTGRPYSTGTIVGTDNDGATPLAQTNNISFVRCRFITQHQAAYAIYHATSASGRAAHDWVFEDCTFTGPSKIFILFGNGSTSVLDGIGTRTGFTVRNCTFTTDMDDWISSAESASLFISACDNVNMWGNKVRYIGKDAYSTTIRMFRLMNCSGTVASNIVQFAGITGGTPVGLDITTSAFENALDAGTVISGGLTIRDNRVGAQGMGTVSITAGGAATFTHAQSLIVGATFIVGATTHTVATVNSSTSYAVAATTAVTSVQFTLDTFGTNYECHAASDADGGGTGALRSGISILMSGNTCFGSVPSAYHYNLYGVVTDGTNDVHHIDWGVSGQTLASVTDSMVGTVEVTDAGATGAATFSVAPGLIAGETFIANAVTYTVVSGSGTSFVVTPDTATGGAVAFNIPATVMTYGGSSYTRFLKLWQGSRVTGITYHRKTIGALPKVKIDYTPNLEYSSLGSWTTVMEPLIQTLLWDGAANDAVGVFYTLNCLTGAMAIYTGNAGVNLGINTSTGAPAVRTYGQIQMTVGI